MALTWDWTIAVPGLTFRDSRIAVIPQLQSSCVAVIAGVFVFEGTVITPCAAVLEAKAEGALLEDTGFVVVTATLRRLANSATSWYWSSKIIGSVERSPSSSAQWTGRGGNAARYLERKIEIETVIFKF